MDDFKRTRFAIMHPGVAFPRVEPLDERRMRQIRISLAHAVGFPPEVDNLALTHQIDSLLRPLDALNAEDTSFDLEATIRKAGIAPTERVFVNWYRYDRVDEIDLKSLSRYFRSIWYPSSDDIEILDITCAWILAVTHTGHIAYAIFGQPQPGG